MSAVLLHTAAPRDNAAMRGCDSIVKSLRHRSPPIYFKRDHNREDCTSIVLSFYSAALLCTRRDCSYWYVQACACAAGSDDQTRGLGCDLIKASLSPVSWCQCWC